ncbi:hypothetical protein [Massilia glaciei]|uniref:hypothetical protein n=1 Tax=Massilia glaciei TaxID=1524097 RepID=UPI0011B1DBD7|nr:hypothetical protein [Massilia glaciei]
MDRPSKRILPRLPFLLIQAVALVLAVQNVGRAQAMAPSACKKGDAQCAFVENEGNPIKRKSYWRGAFGIKLENRFASAPPELVRYLNTNNIGSGLSNRPESAAIPPDFRNDVRQAIAELPVNIKKLLDDKLAGIYFVRDLGGTGYTDYVDGGIFSADAGYIVLDIDVLKKYTANAWATWKENTPFRSDPQYRLDVRIEQQESNNRKNAIQYLLLHEIAHVLSIGEKFHPRWDRRLDAKTNLADTPFAKHSWKLDKNFYFVGRFDSTFPLRKDIVYYFGARFDSEQMARVYEQLETTDYPTLYAATRPEEDFAESLVSYIHTVVQKRPLEVRIYRGKALVKTYTSCWEETRCAAKRKILERFLKTSF